MRTGNYKGSRLARGQAMLDFTVQNSGRRGRYETSDVRDIPSACTFNERSLA